MPPRNPRSKPGAYSGTSPQMAGGIAGGGGKAQGGLSAITPTFVAGNIRPNSNTTSASSIDIPLPAGVSNGDLVLIVIFTNVGGRTWSSAGWTSLAVLNSPNVGMEVFYRLRQAGDPTTVTFGISSLTAIVWGASLAYTGVNQVSPIGFGSGNMNGVNPAASIDLASQNTTAPNSRVVWIAGGSYDSGQFNDNANLTLNYAQFVSGQMMNIRAESNAYPTSGTAVGLQTFTVTGGSSNFLRLAAIEIKAP